MSELLEQTFFQHALVAGVLVAVTCSFVGVYVLLKRIVFLGIALAQIASAGVALALLLGWNPLLTALAASLAGAVAFSQIRWRGRAPIEGVLGISYVLAAALGTVFLAKNPVGEARALSALFGNILSVPKHELAALAVVAAAVTLIHLQFRKEFVFVSFDFETAAAHGVRARLWNLLLYLTLGVAIAFAIRSSGVLVTFALLVVPSMGARLLTASIGTMFVAAVGLATLSIPIGLGAAFALDLPTGATISLTVALLFAAALGVRAVSRAVRRIGAAAALAAVVIVAGADPALAQPPAGVEDELRALREAVNDLRKIVNEQQRLIQELRRGQPAAAAPAPARASVPADPSAAGPTAAPAEAPSASEAAPLERGTVERHGLPPYLAYLPEFRVEGNFIGNKTFGDRRELERQLGEERDGDAFFIRRDRLNIKEVQLGLRSAIDPFARFEATFSANQTFGGDLSVDLEEAFINSRALPGRLELKVGKFRTSFGEFNDSGPEEIPEVNSPNVIVNLFGREGGGWVDTGLLADRIFGVTDEQSVTLSAAVFNGDNEAAFHGGRAGVGRRPAWYGRFQHFIEFGPLTGFEWGFAYAEGRTLDDLGRADLPSRIFNSHVKFRYKEPVLALYRGFNLLGEFFYSWRDRRVVVVNADTGDAPVRFDTLNRVGLYTLAEAQVARNWSIGGRFDYSELPDRERPDGGVPAETAGSLILSYRPSRFLTLRAQYTHTARNFALDSDEVFLQALFKLGFERPGPF